MENLTFKSTLPLLSIYFMCTVFLFLISRELTTLTFTNKVSELSEDTTEDPLDHFMEVNYGFGLPIKSSLEKDSLSCNNQYIPSKIEISRSLTTFTVCQGRYVDTSIAILAFDSNKSPSTLVRDIITSDSNLTNKTSMKCIQDKSFQLNKNMPNYVLDCTYQINSRSLFTSVLVLYPIKVLGIGNAIVITGSSENETKENLREVSKKIVYLPY